MTKTVSIYFCFSRNISSLILFGFLFIVNNVDFSPASSPSHSPKPKTEAMVRSPPVMSPSTATQMDSKMPNQGKPGSAGSQSQPSPCDPKTLSAKGAQNVAGGLGLKNGQGLSSGPSSKVKVKRERSTSVESFEQPESGTPTGDDKGKFPGASY